MTVESQPPKPIFRTSQSVRDWRLSVSPNKRYLVNQAGQPFFYLADTAWTLFKRLSHEDVDIYFRNRVAKGFTVIQAYVLRGLEVPNLYGHLPLVDRDPARLDPGFFGNIDYVVNRANELGLVPALVTTMGEHVRKGKRIGERYQKDEQIFTRENAFAYGRILGRRYRQNCVIWLLGGDRMPTEDMETWDAMGRGLKDGSEGVHLVSYHSCGGTSSSTWFHNHDWLDFNTIQSRHRSADPNYELVTQDYGLSPVKPTLDMESRFENHPDGADRTRRMDAHQAREAAWWAVLAGAAGHGYGCNDIWQMHDETKVDSTRDYSFPLIPPTANWRTAMDFDGAFGVGYMRKLVELRPWYRMVPDQSVIASGQGEGEDHVQAARAADGSFILAYLTFGNPVSVRMDRITGGAVKAQWYDPRSGTFIRIGQYPNTGVRGFLAPSRGRNNDWVLVVEDAAKGYRSELA
jgi:hypothetical protein